MGAGVPSAGDVLAQEVPEGKPDRDDGVADRPERTGDHVRIVDGGSKGIAPGVRVMTGQAVAMFPNAVIESRIAHKIINSTAPPTAASGASVSTPSMKAKAPTTDIASSR